MQALYFILVFYTCRDKIVCSLQSKLNVLQISRGSFPVPTDVTLKLSDGNIDAHKIILAGVSPVFERMFYGDFKEGKSSEIALPSDSYKVIKLLIDFVYNGKCEVSRLDDLLPLLEVLDRYQMNKIPFQHLISEAVLAKLCSSNYLTLLPQFASVMSDEGNRKAAGEVIKYIKGNIIGIIQDDIVSLPEEVLLPLLQTCCLQCYDLDVFNFLVKWHNYQTKTLNKSLKLTAQIFRCIRYSLIIPQILTSTVARCDLVDKQLISEAIDYIYNANYQLGAYNDENPCKPTAVQFSRKPELGSKIEWVACDGVTIAYKHVNQSYISGNCCALSNNEYVIVKSKPLDDGIYSFSVSDVHSSCNNITLRMCFSITQSSMPEVNLYANRFQQPNLVSLYVRCDFLFVKYIVGRVVSAFTTSVRGPLCIHMFMCKKSLTNISSDSKFSCTAYSHK